MRVKTSIKRYTLVLITGITASILLTLSYPRLKASIRYLPVDTALANYYKTDEIDRKQLDGLIERAQEVIQIHDHYRYYEGLSELHILNRQGADQSTWQRRDALKASIKAAEQALQRAPARPRTWLRIARAGEFLTQAPETIIKPWKMSIFTGRYEPTLMTLRLELGMRYLPSLDDEGLQLLQDQAVLTWQTQQRQMLKRIKAGAINPGQLRGLLGIRHQHVVAEIEAGLNK